MTQTAPLRPLLLLTGFLAFQGCKEPVAKNDTPPAQDAATPAAEGLPDRDPALARRLVREEGALLIDVRTPEEFAEGHVEGAWNVPVDRVEQELSAIEAKAGGDKSKPIVVYCRSGRRAAKAKEILLQHGFTRVTNLGGLSDWCEDC